MMFIVTVIETLNRYRVPYVLVGGYAVALHGAVRGTVDIDIAIALNRKSYRQLEKAMNSIGLLSRLPVSADEVFDYRAEYIKNRNLKAWSFVNNDKPLEIVDILITEDARTIKTVNKTAMGTRLKVAAIDDLIRMKKKANRKQDKEDIKALEKLK